MLQTVLGTGELEKNKRSPSSSVANNLARETDSKQMLRTPMGQEVHERTVQRKGAKSDWLKSLVSGDHGKAPRKQHLNG